MATETEVERMVARLVGDTQQFTTSFEDASKTAEETADRIGKATDGISAKTIAMGQVMADAITWAANKIKQFGQDALDGFAEAELGELKLKTALESNGRAVESTLQQYKDYANELQKVTTAEDDYVLTLFKTAEQFDTTGDAAKRAVHDAFAMAAANDSSADSMIRLTAAMAKGDTETAMRFGRMIPQLRGVRDEAQFVAKYAQLVKSGFAQAEAETKTFTGTMKQMKVAFGNALEVVGQVVAEAIQPLVRWIKEASDWFQTLSPEVTRTIAVISMITAAVGTFILAWGPISTVLAGIGTVIATVFSPLGLLLAGIGAAVYMVVQEMGGWEKSWQMIKNAAINYWEYVRPTLELFYSVAKDMFTAVWETAKDVFSTIKTFVIGVWDKMGGKVKSWFNATKNFLQEAAIVAGYVFTNFGTISDLLWTNLKLGVVEFANTVEYYFTEVIPAWFNYFAENAFKIFGRMYENTKKFFVNLGENIVELVANIPKLMSGEISMTDWTSLWKPVGDGFEKVLTDLPVVAQRKRGKLEQELLDESRALTDVVAEGYATYRDRKLNEMKDLTKPAEDIDKGVIKPAEIAANALKHVGKAGHDAAKEATEFGSSEHIKRLGDYFDALRGGTDAAKDAGAAAKGAVGGAGGDMAGAAKQDLSKYPPGTYIDKFGIPVIPSTIPENEKHYKGKANSKPMQGQFYPALRNERPAPGSPEHTPLDQAVDWYADSVGVPKLQTDTSTSGQSEQEATNALLQTMVEIGKQQLKKPQIKVATANL